MKTERPWGWYEVIDTGDRYKVKNIEVKPGHRLSLQKHHHRTEHWIVVSGTAEVQLNDARQLIGENQSTYIPLGCKHRLSCLLYTSPSPRDLSTSRMPSSA